MFQRKLIVVLSVAAMLAMTAGVSQGSWSRVEGMGLSVPAMSQFTDDYANMFAYPTSVVRQNNIVWAELGNNPGGGVNSVDTEDQTFTLVRNFPRLGAIAFQMKQNALNSTVASDNLNNEQLDIIWGKAFSSFDFAVRLDITNSSLEFTDNSPFGYDAHGIDFSGDPYPFGAAFFEDVIVDNPGDIEINTYGITPAIAIHMDNDDRFEAAATYRRYTLDRSNSPAPVETFEDGGNASYALNARAILHRGGTHTWYPAAWYVNDDLSWEVNGAPGTTTARSADESYKQFGIGISDNMRVNSDNLLLWGVMFAQDKHSYERTDNNEGVDAPGVTRNLEEKHTMMPLVFVAIETQATSWLTVRIGGSRGMVSSRDEFTDFGLAPFSSTLKTRESEFNFSLGTGIKWNNLDVDMTLNEEFPLSGGYILSGNEATPFTRVSATYHF
jgi:hypothetical protein